MHELMHVQKHVHCATILLASLLCKGLLASVHAGSNQTCMLLRFCWVVCMPTSNLFLRLHCPPPQFNSASPLTNGPYL